MFELFVLLYMTCSKRVCVLRIFSLGDEENSSRGSINIASRNETFHIISNYFSVCECRNTYLSGSKLLQDLFISLVVVYRAIFSLFIISDLIIDMPNACTVRVVYSTFRGINL